MPLIVTEELVHALGEVAEFARGIAHTPTGPGMTVTLDEAFLWQLRAAVDKLDKVIASNMHD